MENNLYFVSLGCDKNLVDSEHLLYDLTNNGFNIVDDPIDARVIIVNTCCFIGDALEESINTCLSLAGYKESGVCESLIITGCMAQRFYDSISAEIPEIDGCVGVNSYHRLIEVINDTLNGKKVFYRDEVNDLYKCSGRLITGVGISASLKIAEGCAKHCTYCVIPQIKGTYRSVPMDELIKEAEDLASRGIKELIIIAQETTCYGIDLYKEKCLHKLINRLSDIDGIEWIRLMYAYPEEIYDELIAEMASNPKVCHYIDMPIQHCNDDVLKRMGRLTTKDNIIDVISRLRKAMPDITIRTTLIVGFPGEDDDMYEELLDFVSDMKFERLGAFCYSREDETPAAGFEDQIDDSIKIARYKRLMEAQQNIAFFAQESLIGKRLDVMIEGYLRDDDVYIARSYRDAPDVDGIVFVECERELITGSIVNVEIISSEGYDLIGEFI